MNNVISEEIPMQWRRTRTALQFIEREALQIWKDAKTDAAKMQALSLFSATYQKEFELVSNSTIIDEALRFVSNNNLKEVLTQLGNKQK